MDDTALVAQFGGGRVQEGEPNRWRSMNSPTESLLVPARVPTHWHQNGTVDFAVFNSRSSSRVVRYPCVISPAPAHNFRV